MRNIEEINEYVKINRKWNRKYENIMWRKY